MKKALQLLLITGILLSTRCTTDFDLTAESEEIPIIFTLLNQNDSIHYVRVQRAYLIDGNALDAAQVPDSIYYTDPEILHVTLKNVATGQTMGMTPVVGDTLEIFKELGVFANSPNLLYQYIGMLNGENTHRVKVENLATGQKAVAYTNLIKSFIIKHPKAGRRLDFSDTLPINVTWVSAENARLYDLNVRFHYREWNTSDPSLVFRKHVDWVVFRNETSIDADGGDDLKVQIDPSELFRLLRNKLGVHLDSIRRFDITNGLEFTFVAGGEILYKYRLVLNAQSGLSSNEAVPTFTNVEGGLGVVSSSYEEIVKVVQMTDVSIDSLSCGRFTKDLNFLSSNGTLFCD